MSTEGQAWLPKMFKHLIYLLKKANWQPFYQTAPGWKTKAGNMSRNAVVAVKSNPCTSHIIKLNLVIPVSLPTQWWGHAGHHPRGLADPEDNKSEVTFDFLLCSIWTVQGKLVLFLASCRDPSFSTRGSSKVSAEASLHKLPSWEAQEGI